MPTERTPGRHRTAAHRRAEANATPAGARSVRGQAAARVTKMIAAACSVVLFAAFGYGWYNYDSLTRHQHTLAISGLGEPNTGGGGTRTVTHVNGDAQNILVVGVDSREGLTAGEKRYYRVGQGDQSLSTDTIMVVHVPSNGMRATLLSIPRDTYVQIPGFADNKINAAYADGYYDSGATSPDDRQRAGASELVGAVKNLTGLSLDHYVQVGFSGFVNIVKAIGNVPVNLCQPVNDTYTHNRNAGIQGASGFRMSAGRHDLDPQQALEFVRQRHNIPGPVSDDLGRELRQRYFLKQAFSKIASARTLLNPFKLRQLVSAVDGAFTFDNRNFGMLQFAEQMSDLTAGNIRGKSIPVTGDYNYGGNVGDALTVDTAAVHRFAHNLFYGAPTSRRTTSPPRAPAATSRRPASASSPPSTARANCIN